MFFIQQNDVSNLIILINYKQLSRMVHVFYDSFQFHYHCIKTKLKFNSPAYLIQGVSKKILLTNMVIQKADIICIIINSS